MCRVECGVCHVYSECCVMCARALWSVHTLVTFRGGPCCISRLHIVSCVTVLAVHGRGGAGTLRVSVLCRGRCYLPRRLPETVRPSLGTVCLD